MKTLSLTFAFVALMFCGCATTPVDNAAAKPKAPLKLTPLIQEEVVTEDVELVPDQTNVVTGVSVDPVSHTLLTNDYIQVVPAHLKTNLHTNSSYVPNPIYTGALSGAKTLNQYANPTPIAPIISGVLALLSGGLGFYARIKNKQAIDSQEKHDAKEELLNTVVAGVELFGSADQKKKINEVAYMRGVQTDLHEHVQSVVPK